MKNKETKTQTEYTENAEEIKEYEDYMNGVIEEGQRNFAATRPAIAAKFKYKNAGYAYLPNNLPYKAIAPILDIMLQLKCADRPKAEILRKVIESNLEFKDKLNHNVWTKTMKPFQLNKLQVRIDGSAYNSIKLKGCKTLNDVRKRLIAYEVAKGATFEKKISVIIDSKNVLVGNKQYAITNRNLKGKVSPYIRPKRHWIRLDALKELLS